MSVERWLFSHKIAQQNEIPYQNDIIYQNYKVVAISICDEFGRKIKISPIIFQIAYRYAAVKRFRTLNDISNYRYGIILRFSVSIINIRRRTNFFVIRSCFLWLPFQFDMELWPFDIIDGYLQVFDFFIISDNH